MRSRNLAVLVLVAMTLFVTDALSLDLRGALRSAADQVLDNAVRGSSPEPQQYQSYQQPQQQQTQSYTYEEYMAAQGGGDAATNVAATSPQDTAIQAAEDFDSDNPFAGLVENDVDQPSANAGKGSNGQEGDTIEVVATGIGTNSDQALKNALRAAIEQAVGTMIDSETLAQNDEVVSDQILSYSAGFVQSHSVIGEPKMQDGLVMMRIKAQVKKTELVAKLEAASIHVADVDGESLFGEAITKINQAKSSADIVKKAFNGFSANVLEIKGPSKDNPPAYDESTHKLTIDIEISINRDKYREFIQKVIPVLMKVSSDHQRISVDSQVGRGGHSGAPNNNGLNFNLDVFHNWLQKKNIIAICTQINDARTNSIWETFIIPEEAFNDLWFKNTVFTVNIVDRNGEIISSSTGNHAYPTIREDSKRFIFPLLADSSALVNGFIHPGTNKRIYRMSFDASPDEVRRMRNISCKIEYK